MEDLIIECAKCRVLCKSCHRIHTRFQIENKIINPNRDLNEKDYKIGDNLDDSGEDEYEGYYDEQYEEIYIE